MKSSNPLISPRGAPLPQPPSSAKPSAKWGRLMTDTTTTKGGGAPSSSSGAHIKSYSASNIFEQRAPMHAEQSIASEMEGGGSEFDFEGLNVIINSSSNIIASSRYVNVSGQPIQLSKAHRISLPVGMQNTNMIRIREEPLPPNTFLGRRTDKITAAKPPSARSRSGNAPHALSPDFGVMSTEELLQHLATSSTSDGSFFNVVSRYRLEPKLPYQDFYDLVFVDAPGSGAKSSVCGAQQHNISAQHVMRLSSGGLLFFESEGDPAPTLLSTSDFRWQRGCVLALQKTIFFGKFRQYKYFSAWHRLTKQQQRGGTLHRLLKESVYSDTRLTSGVVRTVSSIYRLENEVSLFYYQVNRLLVLSDFLARQTDAVSSAGAQLAYRLNGLVEYLSECTAAPTGAAALQSKRQQEEYQGKVARLMRLAKFACDAAVCRLVLRFFSQLRQYLANEMTVLREKSEQAEAVLPCMDVCLLLDGCRVPLDEMLPGDDMEDVRVRALPSESERSKALAGLYAALAGLLQATQNVWRGRIVHRELFGEPALIDVLHQHQQQERSYDQWLQETESFSPLADPALRHCIAEHLEESSGSALRETRQQTSQIAELFAALTSIDISALVEALGVSALKPQLAFHIADGVELETEHAELLLSGEWFKLKEMSSAAERMARVEDMGRDVRDIEHAGGLVTSFRPALEQVAGFKRALTLNLLRLLPTALQARTRTHLQLLAALKGATVVQDRGDFESVLRLLMTMRSLHDIRHFLAAEVSICNGAHGAHTQLRSESDISFGALDKAMQAFNNEARAFDIAIKNEKELCTQQLPQLRLLLLSRTEEVHARILAASVAVTAAAEAPAAETSYPERIRSLRSVEGEVSSLRSQVSTLQCLQELLRTVPDYLDLRYNLLSAANIAANFEDMGALERQYRNQLDLLQCVQDLRTLRQQILACPVAADAARANFEKLQSVKQRSLDLSALFCGRPELAEAQLLLKDLAPKADVSCFLCVGSSSMAFWKQMSAQVLPRTNLSLRLAGAGLRFIEAVETSVHGSHSLGNIFKLRFSELSFYGVEQYEQSIKALTYAVLTEARISELLVAVRQVIHALRLDMRDPKSVEGRRGSTDRRYSVLRAPAVDPLVPAQLEEPRYIANEQTARFVIGYCEKTMTSIVDVCYNMKISSLASAVKEASHSLDKIKALFSSFNFIKLAYVKVNPYAFCGDKDDITPESVEYFEALSRDMLSVERVLQQRAVNGNLLHASNSLQSLGVHLHEVHAGFAALYAEMHASIMALVELSPRLSLLSYTKLVLLFRASKLGFASEGGDLTLLSSCLSDMFAGSGALQFSAGACTGFVSRDRCEVVRFFTTLPLELRLADFVLGFERELRLVMSRRIDEVMLYQIQEMRAFLAAATIPDIFAQIDSVFEQRLLHLMSSVSDGVPNQVFVLVNACRFYEDVALALGTLGGCYAHARPDLVQSPAGNVVPSVAASWRDNVARLRTSCDANLDHIYQAHAGSSRIFCMPAKKRKVHSLCGSLAAQEAYFRDILSELLALEDSVEASLYVEGRYKLAFVYLHEMRVQESPFDISIGGVDYPYGLEYFGGTVAVVADAKTEKLMLEVLTVALSRRVSLLLHDDRAATAARGGRHFVSVRDVSTALGRLCLPLVAAESTLIARLVLSRAVHLDAVAFFDSSAVSDGCADMYMKEYAKFVRCAADPSDVDFDDQLQFLFDRPRYIRRTDSQMMRRRDSQRRLRLRLNDTMRANCRVGLLLVAVASQSSPPAALQREHQPLLAPILLSKQRGDGLALRLAAKGFRHATLLGEAYDKILLLLSDSELIPEAVHVEALSAAFVTKVVATARLAASLCVAMGHCEDAAALLRSEVCALVAALFEALCAETVDKHALWAPCIAQALEEVLWAQDWTSFIQEDLAASTTLRHYSRARAETAVKEAARKHSLLADAFFIASCRRLWAQLRRSPVLLLAGASGCGKSSLRQAAAELIERRAFLPPEAGAAFLHPLRAARLIAGTVRAWWLSLAVCRGGSGSAARGVSTTTVIYNSSLSLSGLAGFSDSSGYWKDGLLTRRLRAIEDALSDGSGGQAFTLVLDGPVSFAVEQIFTCAYNLSTLAGDGTAAPRVLSLPSGELYPLPPQLRIIIETSDISGASPFFLAANPLHIVQSRDAETTCRRMTYPWFSVLQRQLHGYSFWIRPLKEVGRLLFGSRLLDGLLLAGQTDAAAPSLAVSRISTFLKYAEQLLLALHNAAIGSAVSADSPPMDRSRLLEGVQLALVYSALWAFGGAAAADPSRRLEKAFDLGFREALYSSLPNLRLPDPSISLFELELSLETCELRPIHLARGASRVVLWTGGPQGAESEMYVQSARTVALESALIAALQSGQMPLLYGPRSSGKSRLADKVLEQLSRKSIHPLRSDIRSETLSQLVAGLAPRNSIPSAVGGIIDTFAQLRSAVGGARATTEMSVHSLLSSRRPPANYMEEQNVFVARTSMSMNPSATALRAWLAREFASDVDFILATPLDSFAVVFIDDVATAADAADKDDSVQGLLRSLTDGNLPYNLTRCTQAQCGLVAPFEALAQLHRDRHSDPRLLLVEPDNYEMQNAALMLACGDDIGVSLSSRFLLEVLKRSALFCIPTASAAELHQTMVSGLAASLYRCGVALPAEVHSRIASLCEVTVNVSEKLRRGSDRQRLTPAEHRVQSLIESRTLALVAPSAASLAARQLCDAEVLMDSFCSVWRAQWFDACPSAGVLRDKLSSLLKEELGFVDPTKWGISVDALERMLHGAAALPTADASRDLRELFPADEGDNSKIVNATGLPDSEGVKFALFGSAMSAVLRVARVAAGGGNILLLGLQGDARGRLLRLAAHICSRQLLAFENVHSDSYTALLDFARGALLRLCGLRLREVAEAGKYLDSEQQQAQPNPFEIDGEGERQPLLLAIDPSDGGLPPAAQVLLALLAREDGDVASLFSSEEVMSLYQLMQTDRYRASAEVLSYTAQGAEHEHAPALQTTAYHSVQAFLREHIRGGLAIVYSVEEARAVPMQAPGLTAQAIPPPLLHLLRHSFQPLWLDTDTHSAVSAACSAALNSNDGSAGTERCEARLPPGSKAPPLSILVRRGALSALQQQLGLSDTLAIFSLAPQYGLEGYCGNEVHHALEAHRRMAEEEVDEWQRETSARAAAMLLELLLTPAPSDALVLLQPISVTGPSRAAEVAASIAASLVRSHCSAMAPKRRMLHEVRAAVDEALDVVLTAGGRVAAQFSALRELEAEAAAARSGRLELAQLFLDACRERERLPSSEREAMSLEDYCGAQVLAETAAQCAQRCVEARRQVLEVYPSSQWKDLGAQFAAKVALEDEALLTLGDALCSLCDYASSKARVRGRAVRSKSKGKETARRAAAFFQSSGAKAKVCALALALPLGADKQRLLRELCGSVLASGEDAAGPPIDPLNTEITQSSLAYALRLFLASLRMRAHEVSGESDLSAGAAERWEAYAEAARGNATVSAAAAEAEAVERAALESRICSINSDIEGCRRQLESLSSIADSRAPLLAAVSQYSDSLRSDAAELERSSAPVLGDICIAAAVFARASYLPEAVRGAVLRVLRARARACGWATSEQDSLLLGSLLHPLQHRLWFGHDPLDIPRSTGALNAVSLAMLSPRFTYIVDPDGVAEKALVMSLPPTFEARVVAARTFSLDSLTGWLQELDRIRGGAGAADDDPQPVIEGLALIVTAVDESCSEHLRLLLSAEVVPDPDGGPACAVISGATGERRLVLSSRLRLYVLSPTVAAPQCLPSCCFKNMSLLLWSSETAAYCDGSIGNICATGEVTESSSASELSVSLLCMAIAPTHLFEVRALGRDVLRLSREHAASSNELLRALYASRALREQGSSDAYGVLSSRRLRQLLLSEVPRLRRLGALKATVERTEERVLAYHACLLGALSKATAYLAVALSLIPADLAKKTSIRAILNRSIHTFFSDARQRRLIQGFPQSEARLRRVLCSVLLMQSRFRGATVVGAPPLSRTDRLRRAQERACGDFTQVSTMARQLLLPLQHCLLEIVQQQVESIVVPGFEWLARFAMVVCFLSEGGSTALPLDDIELLAYQLGRLGALPGSNPNRNRNPNPNPNPNPQGAERYALAVLYAETSPSPAASPPPDEIIAATADVATTNATATALRGDLFQGELLALSGSFVFSPTGARFLLTLGSSPAYVDASLRLRRSQLKAARMGKVPSEESEAAQLAEQRHQAAEASDNSLLLSLHDHFSRCMPRPDPPLSAAQAHAINSQSLVVAGEIAASRHRSRSRASKSDADTAAAMGPLDSDEIKGSVLLLEHHPRSSGVFLGLSRALVEQEQDFQGWREALVSLARVGLDDPAVDLVAAARTAAAPAASRVFRLDGARKGSYLVGKPLTVVQTMVLAEAVAPGSSRALMLLWFRLLTQHLANSGACSAVTARAQCSDWAQLLSPCATGAAGPPRALRGWLGSLRKVLGGRDRRQVLHPFLLGTGHSRSLEATKLQTSLAVCRHYLDALLAVVREDVQSLIQTFTLDLALFERLSSLGDAEARFVTGLIFLWQTVVNTRAGRAAGEPWCASKPAPWQLVCLIFSCIDVASSGLRRQIAFGSVEGVLKNMPFRLAALYCAACFHDNAGLLSGASDAAVAADVTTGTAHGGRRNSSAGAGGGGPSARRMSSMTVSTEHAPARLGGAEEMALRLKDATYVAFTKFLAAVMVTQDVKRLAAGTRPARRGSAAVSAEYTGEDIPEYRCLLARSMAGESGAVSRHSFGRLKLSLDAGAAFRFAGLHLDEVIALLIGWIFPDNAGAAHGRR